MPARVSQDAQCPGQVLLRAPEDTRCAPRTAALVGTASAEVPVMRQRGSGAHPTHAELRRGRSPRLGLPLPTAQASSSCQSLFRLQE